MARAINWTRHRDAAAGAFSRLGMDLGSYDVIKLLPVVFVAWADGTLSQTKRERIVAMAQSVFHIGDAARRILEQWLRERPPAAYFADGLRTLSWLAHAPDEPQVSVDDLPGVLLHAEAIARTHTGTLDAPSAVSDGEERALGRVAQLLGVDIGRCWSRVLRELESGPLQQPT